MPELKVPVDKGYVSSRGRQDLIQGEMHTVHGWRYKPGDPSRLHTATLRTEFGDTTSGAIIKGLALIKYDSGGTDRLVAYTGTTLYKATPRSTGTFSTMTATEFDSAVELILPRSTMTIGRGIIHSEMPQHERGRLHGFQLWINLPAREKMKPASYRDLRPEAIPQVALPGGGSGRVLAGVLDAGMTVAGPIRGISTAPLFLDVRLPAEGRFSHPLPPGHSAFVYAYDGSLAVGSDARPLRAHEAGLLSAGEAVEIVAPEGPAGFLLVAARPLREPVVQYGPFVMNTRDQIEQASADYQRGELV